MTTLGEKLRDLRYTLGATQEEVGFDVGVKQSCVSRWERGKVIPNAKHLSYLAGLFGVGVMELIDLIDDDGYAGTTPGHGEVVQ